MELTRIDVTDWHHFMRETKEIGYKSWIFRGQRCPDWDLTPTLYRELRSLKVQESSYFVREGDLLRTFSSNAHLFLPNLPKLNDNETLEWWATMQHYGAPTRLLDWTYSPYIAAFFALEHAVMEDCCVYGIYVAGVNQANERDLTKWTLPNFHEANDSSPFTVALYSPRISNERLFYQQGVFTVQSKINVPLEEVLERYPEHKKAKQRGFVKFVFKGSQFHDNMSFLHRMNISNRTLFPGVEGLSRSLRLDLVNIASKF